MPKEIVSFNHESLSLSEKEFEADVNFQQSNIPIIFNERNRLIHENGNTTIYGVGGYQSKLLITLINFEFILRRLFS